jgi:hypothetical protein
MNLCAKPIWRGYWRDGPRGLPLRKACVLGGFKCDDAKSP